MRLIAHAATLGNNATRPDWIGAGAWRRLDPLTRLACVTVADLREHLHAGDQVALCCATSYGAIASTITFVDSIATYGDAGASPTPFTTSVHNGTAGALGELLQLTGPSATLSQGSTSCLAALRWAEMQLQAGRAEQVLVIAGECHNEWSEATVAALTPTEWPIASGVAAALLGNNGARELRSGEHPATQCLDGGGIASAEGRLAAAAIDQQRLRAPDVLGGWWPSCLLAALDRVNQAACQLRERDGGTALSYWLGPA